MFRPFWSSSTSALILASYQRWKRFWKRKPNLITHPLLIWGSTYPYLWGDFLKKKHILGLCENMEIHLPQSSSRACGIFFPNTFRWMTTNPGYAIEALCTAELGGLETWKVNQSPLICSRQPSHRNKKNVYPKIKSHFFLGGGFFFLFHTWEGGGAAFLGVSIADFQVVLFVVFFWSLVSQNSKSWRKEISESSLEGELLAFVVSERPYPKIKFIPGGLFFFKRAKNPQSSCCVGKSQVWWS